MKHANRYLFPVIETLAVVLASSTLSTGCGRSPTSLLTPAATSPSATGPAQADSSPIAVLKGEIALDWQGIADESRPEWRARATCAPRRGALIFGWTQRAAASDLILRVHPELMSRLCPDEGSEPNATYGIPSEDRVAYPGGANLFFVKDTVIYGALSSPLSTESNPTDENILTLAGVQVQPAHPVLRVRKRSDDDTTPCRGGQLDVLVPQLWSDARSERSVRWQPNQLTVSTPICEWINQKIQGYGLASESKECRAFASAQDQKCFLFRVAPIFDSTASSVAMGLVVDVTPNDLDDSHLEQAKQELGLHLTAVALDRSRWVADRAAPNAVVASAGDYAVAWPQMSRYQSPREGVALDFIIERPMDAALECRSSQAAQVRLGQRLIPVHPELVTTLCNPGVFASANLWTLRNSDGIAVMTGFHNGTRWIVQGSAMSTQARFSEGARDIRSGTATAPSRTLAPEQICPSEVSSRLATVVHHWHLPVAGVRPTVDEAPLVCRTYQAVNRGGGIAGIYDVLRQVENHFEMVGLIATNLRNWGRAQATFEDATHFSVKGVIFWELSRIPARGIGGRS